MNLERFKSLTLFLLVIMSFVLTTRLWFDISIEGLFPIPTHNKTNEAKLTYDKENLLKPSKLVVHTGINHTLLFNNVEDKDYYSFVLNGAKDSIRDLLENEKNYTQQTMDISELETIRRNKAVELIFQAPIELEHIKSFLNAEKNPWSSLTKLKSIIVSPNESSIYVVNGSSDQIYKFTANQMIGVLEGAVAEAERRNDFNYLFLNEFNKEGSPPIYSDYAVVPINISTMPVLSIKKEIEAKTEVTPDIELFFDKNSSSISSGINPDDGTVTFTDREEATLKIDAKGIMEYYRFNVPADKERYTSLSQALDIAADYADKHLGIPYDFYMSDIKSWMQGVRNSYLINFDYKFNGVPIIIEPEESKSAIEIETLSKEIRRYKRNVSIITSETKVVNIKSFTEILDIVWERLNQSLKDAKSESIVFVNEMHLAYLERNDNLKPVWVVEVKVEGNSDGDEKYQYDKKYIIAAEEGWVLVEQ